MHCFLAGALQLVSEYVAILNKRFRYGPRKEAIDLEINGIKVRDELKVIRGFKTSIFRNYVKDEIDI